MSPAWTLFKVWYARPLPITLRIGILNDTEARALHLGFALLLALVAWPAFAVSPCKSSAMDRLGAGDRRAFAGIYLLVFYSKLATRLGQPKPMPSRWPSPASLAALFIAYAMLGPHMSEVLRHKVASLNRLMSHLCLTTEGVYGIALGVSTGTIFVYVLLGTLLDRAGGS